MPAAALRRSPRDGLPSVMVNVPGLEYELDGSGFWTGAFRTESLSAG